MKWFPHKNEYQLQQFNFVKLFGGELHSRKKSKKKNAYSGI